MTMRIHEFTTDQLTPDLLARWEAIRRTDDAMASPFFASELARLLGEVRDDLRIAMVERGGEAVAFLPFHRGGLRTGLVMGWPLMDYDGLIAEPNLDLDLRQVIRALGLSRFRFLGVPASQRWFESYTRQIESSPMIRTDRFRPSSKDMRKLRRMERDLGPIEFRPSAPGGEDLKQLLAWKQGQVRQTGFYPVFSCPWLVPLLRRLPQHVGENFAGIFSTLHAGGRLVAAHLGLRSETVWHMWFPAYDQAYSAYSPGLLLMNLMAQTGPDLGIDMIDFGYGPEGFKQRLANDHTPLVHGTVTSGWASTGYAHGRETAIKTVRRTGVHKHVRQVNAALRTYL